MTRRSVSANASSIAELSPTPSSDITTAATTTEPTTAEPTTIQIAPNTTETAPIAPTTITTEPGIDLDNGDGENDNI